MRRRLLKQRYMATLHGREGHAYRVYLSANTVADLQALYESSPQYYREGWRVQDMASQFLADTAREQRYYEALQHRTPIVPLREIYRDE